MVSPVVTRLRITMSDENAPNVQLQKWLEAMRAGDKSAREHLISHFCHQLQRHAQKMLRGYPALRRWVETDDVFQNSMMRLLRALEEVQPASPAHFLSLAALQIRRELVDLVRHYFGPQGRGTHHSSGVRERPNDSESQLLFEPACESDDPSRLAAWAEFHEHTNHLPEEERQVFDLLWYQEMTQPEAAAVLGISERTLKRRWQSARLHLHEALEGRLPDW